MSKLSDCRINPVFHLFGTKWTTLIIKEIFSGHTHYGELMKQIPGISSRTLSNRLRTLEENKILTRTVYPTNPPSVEYKLTKIGEDASYIFDTMLDWNYKWKKAIKN